MTPSSFLRAAAIAAAATWVASCSSSKPPIESLEVVCKRKFDDAKKDYDKGRDPDAQTKLKDVTVTCLQFDYAESAQYMLSESYYRSQQWIEAETEFGILAANYERGRYREEAVWKVARSAWNQAPTWDRDPSLTEKAIQKEDAFLAEFPKGGWADSARQDLADLEGRMADRRFQTARLYMNMDEPQAATLYYHLLLKEYPQSGHVPQARLDLVKAYGALNQFDRAQENLDSLKLDSRSAILASEMEKARRDLAKNRKTFEARKAREAEEARQGKL